jgi:hypothetical protein
MKLTKDIHLDLRPRGHGEVCILYPKIQGDSGEANILRVYSIGYCGGKSIKYVCNCYIDTKTELFLSLDLFPLDFYLRGWMKREVYKRNVDTPDEMLARRLDAARLKKRQTNNMRPSHTSCKVY